MKRLGLLILLLTIQTYIYSSCELTSFTVNGEIIAPGGSISVCEGSDVHIDFGFTCIPCFAEFGPTVRLTRSTGDLDLTAKEIEGFTLPNVVTARYFLQPVGPGVGCSGEQSFFDLTVTPAFTITNIVNPGCGLANGEIEGISSLAIRNTFTLFSNGVPVNQLQNVGPGDVFTFTGLAAQTYTIVAENDNCRSEQTVVLQTIEDFPIKVTVCRDIPVTLTAPEIVGATYQWAPVPPVPVDDQNKREITVTVTDETTFTVTISLNNGQCQNSNSVTLVPVECPQDSAVCITKCGPERIHCNEKFKYVIRVTNAGTSDATELVVVDTLPNCVQFVGFESTDFELESIAGQVIRFKQKNDLAPCTSSKIKLRVKANNCSQRTITNTACLEGLDRCSNPVVTKVVS